MPTPMTGWKSHDGRWFDDERSATRYEVMAEIRKSFPQIADRVVQIERVVDRLSLVMMPLALVSGEPPLDLAETTLETTLEGQGRDATAPVDNLPNGWFYVHSYDDDDGRRTDTYEKDGARVDWRRSNLYWPTSMTGRASNDEAVARFGSDTPFGCAHEWEIDKPVNLVDTCKHCGEERA